MKPEIDINALMIGKLVDTLTQPEREFIDKLLETDPKVKEVYDNLRSRFDTQDLNNNFQRFKTEEYWEEATDVVNKSIHRRVVVIRRIAWAAAVLLLISVGGYLLVNRQQVSQPRQQIAKATEKNVIKLQLAGGKTIDLSVHQGQVLAEGATLNNAGKALTYSVDETGASAAGYNILTVPMGKDYKVLLEDGTEVWLNSETTLRFPFKFTGNKREITISGEAYINVAKNATKPFIVHTPNSSIQVLGTQFNVNTYDKDIVRVALVQGSVQLKGDAEEVIIKPGQQAVYTGKGNEITIGAFNEDEVLSWREGIHYFHDTSIREICSVFPRWYGTAIVIDNKQLENKRFSGILNRNEPLESFLNVLKATTSINDYYFDKSGVLHLK